MRRPYTVPMRCQNAILVAHHPNLLGQLWGHINLLSANVLTLFATLRVTQFGNGTITNTSAAMKNLCIISDTILWKILGVGQMIQKIPSII
jgi:hypothetical protein